MKSARAIGLWGVITLFSVLLVTSACAAAAEDGPSEPVEALFAQALEAEGEDYVEIREAIVRNGTEALPFLGQRSADEDWHSRSLAEAMAGRITDPMRYRHYEEVMRVAVKKRVVSTVIPLEFVVVARPTGPGVVARLLGGPGQRMDGSDYRVIRGITEKAVMPFLIEVLVKSCTTRLPPVNRLPENDSEKAYTALEIAEILNITPATARYWFRRGLSPRLSTDGNGKPRVRHIHVERFLKPHRLLRGRSGGPSPGYTTRTRCYAAARLGSFRDPAVLPVLIEALDYGPAVAPYAAIGLGITEHVDAVAPLIKALSHDVWKVRRNAARWLGRMGDDRAVAPLAHAMMDANREVRKTAARALGEVKAPGAVQALIGGLRHEDTYVREAAADGLGKLRASVALEPLIAAVSDRDIRVSAILALGEIGDRRATGRLIEVLRGKGLSDLSRRLAAEALGKIGDTAAVEALVSSLRDDPEPSVRKMAAFALGEIKDVGATEALIAALEEETHRSVRRDAAQALKSITGKGFGQNAARWRDWWEESRRKE